MQLNKGKCMCNTKTTSNDTISANRLLMLCRRLHWFSFHCVHILHPITQFNNSSSPCLVHDWHVSSPSTWRLRRGNYWFLLPFTFV